MRLFIQGGWTEREVDLPHNFLAQLWRASKDSDFAVPTGATGDTGSF